MKLSDYIRQLSIVVSVFVFFIIAAVTSSAKTNIQAQSVSMPALLQTHSIVVHSGIASTGSTSPTITNNWAGYAVLPSSESETFRLASGNWIQPPMTCNNKTDTEFAPQWIGLDGFASASVEQAGVTAACKKGVQTYQAFTEAFPKAALYLSMTTYPVKSGDTMFASDAAAGISGSNTNFTLIIKDVTANWTRTVNASLPTSDGPFGTSAEWITEDLGNTIPDFGNVQFTNSTAKDNTGLTGGISSFGYQTTFITDSNGFNVVSPSALSGTGNSFTNTWNGSI